MRNLTRGSVALLPCSELNSGPQIGMSLVPCGCFSVPNSNVVVTLSTRELPAVALRHSRQVRRRFQKFSRWPIALSFRPMASRACPRRLSKRPTTNGERPGASAVFVHLRAGLRLAVWDRHPLEFFSLFFRLCSSAPGPRGSRRSLGVGAFPLIQRPHNY